MRRLGYVTGGIALGLAVAAIAVYIFAGPGAFREAGETMRTGDSAGPPGVSAPSASPAASEARGEAGDGGEREVLYWKAPMDPTYISEKPGKSPMGMDLVPVYEGDGGTVPGTVSIDPVTVQNIGVRTAPVERTDLVKRVRTVGRVTYDEKRLHHVHTKVAGWVEKLYIDFAGEKVAEDEMLLEIYSPELVSAQEEFLLAGKYAETMKEVGRPELLGLARRRLELWDVPAHQIKEIEETGQVMKTLHVHSPASGVVVEKPVVEGMYVEPGRNLYTIADLSTVWVHADIYEYEIPWIEEGQTARMTLAAFPGREFTGEVSFIYPYLDAETRTNRVRLEFENPGMKLKPEMYADVVLEPVAARRALSVPKAAVLRTGTRDLVIVARGGGKFAPRDVTLGVETDERYEVVSGLSEGETVVTSAQFLIDSEARLREAVARMLEADTPGEGMDGMDMEEMDHEGMEGTDMKMDHGGMDMKETDGMDMKMDTDMKDMDHGGMKMEMDGTDKGEMRMDHEGMEMDDMNMEMDMNGKDRGMNQAAPGN